MIEYLAKDRGPTGDGPRCVLGHFVDALTILVAKASGTRSKCDGVML